MAKCNWLTSLPFKGLRNYVVCFSVSKLYQSKVASIRLADESRSKILAAATTDSTVKVKAVVKLPCDDCDDSDVFTTEPSFIITYLAKLRFDGTSNELYDMSYHKHNLIITQLAELFI